MGVQVFTDLLIWQRAREHNERSVPHATYEAAAMFSDSEVDQLADLAYHARVGAVLVAAHHAAIADDISEQYRRQAAGGWRGGNRLDHHSAAERRCDII